MIIFEYQIKRNMQSLSQAILDEAISGLSIMHIERDNQELYYCTECAGYHYINDDHQMQEPEEYLEHDKLHLNNRDVAVIAHSIRYDGPTDNLINDWDLVSMEITIKASALGLSRSEALSDIRSWAYECFAWEGNPPPNYSYLAYI